MNAVRGLAKPCGYRLPASSTLCFAKRCMAVLPPGQALGPVLEQIATMTVKIKLPRPAATAQPVRRARPAARHHQGWQHLSPQPAGRVRQPCARAAWKRLDPAPVGATSCIARRQAVTESSHRRRRSQARCPAPSHLGHPGALHPVLCSSCLRIRIMFTVANPAFR